VKLRVRVFAGEDDARRDRVRGVVGADARRARVATAR
jgi:hypothetical protein